MLSVRSLVAATAICTTLAPLASPVFACRCVFAPPLVALARSDAVFSGRVAEVTVTGWTAVARLEVIDCWKGGVGGTVAVSTASSSAACGIDFAVGAEYLVYAVDSGGLHTNLCSRTWILEYAGADIEALGDPNCVVAVAPAPWGQIKRHYQ